MPASSSSILSTSTANVLGTLLKNQGAIYDQMGAFVEALKSFQTAVEILPDNAAAHLNMATVLSSKLGEHAKAIRYCAKGFILTYIPLLNDSAYVLIFI